MNTSPLHEALAQDTSTNKYSEQRQREILELCLAHDFHKWEETKPLWEAAIVKGDRPYYYGAFHVFIRQLAADKARAWKLNPKGQAEHPFDRFRRDAWTQVVIKAMEDSRELSPWDRDDPETYKARGLKRAAQVVKGGVYGPQDSIQAEYFTQSNAQKA